MSHYSRLLSALLLVASSTLAGHLYAQGTVIDVFKEGAGRTSITLAPLASDDSAAARLFLGTLSNDLTQSGYFSVKPSGGVVVTGSVAMRGASLAVAYAAANASTQRRYAGGSITVPGGEARQLAHRVADNIVESVTGKRGIASTRILLVGSQASGKNLYYISPDGSDLKQLTRDNKPCLSPAWFPGSKQLVYTSMHRGFPDVYRIDLVSGKRDAMVKYPGINAGADISPSGKQMAVTLSKDANPELYVKELRSGKLTRLTTTKFAAEASPSWSPDGRKIAFVSDASGRPQVYVVDRRGGKPKRIAYMGREAVAPDWGPDGRIIYASRIKGRYQLVIWDPSTGKEQQITTDYVDHEDPSWAPNGRHVAFSRTERYQSEVYVLDTIESTQLRLTRLQGDWYSPAWSRE
jgi:TolB protein